MDRHRRNMIRLTAAGLLHISARPYWANANEREAALLLRKATERGHTDLGWLDSYHSFSFGSYYDQQVMGFRSLRVINDDRILPGRGFPNHPHRNMEILSFVLSGSLEHRDSTGQGSIVRPGEVQLMSAGTGISHSEYNPSRINENHFLQIWIQPALNGLQPTYQQTNLAPSDLQNQWRQIAGPEKQKRVVAVHQDVRIYATNVQSGHRIEHVVQRGRYAWLHVAKGELVVNGTKLGPGDAVATSRPTVLNVDGSRDAQALLFDLA